MVKFSVGDIVYWEIRRGIRPRGKVTQVLNDYGGYKDYVRYRVEALDDLTFKSRVVPGDNKIAKGEKFEFDPSDIHKVR